MSQTPSWSESDRFVRLPILPGSKRPLVRDWQNLPPDSREISLPFEVFEKAGKQISMGYRLDGLVVVDCDSGEAVLWWKTLVGDHSTPFISIGRPERASFWYRAPEGWDCGTFRPHRDVEVRSGAGAQCVVPPSIHPDTHQPYRWVMDREPQRPSELPLMPLVVLERLASLQPARDHAAASGGTWDCWPEGERDEWLTRVAGWLKEKGATEEALLRALPALNQALCVPPIRDPERIARSVARYQDLQWDDDDVESGSPVQFVGE